MISLCIFVTPELQQQDILQKAILDILQLVATSDSLFLVYHEPTTAEVSAAEAGTSVTDSHSSAADTANDNPTVTVPENLQSAPAEQTVTDTTAEASTNDEDGSNPKKKRLSHEEFHLGLRLANVIM